MTDAVDPAPAEPAKPAGKFGPQKWWQWFFIYPAFGLALLTAAPNWVSVVKEMYLDLKDRDLEDAEAQRRLFAENISCLQQEFQRFETDDGLKIDAVICDQTAAIILRLMADDDRHRVIAIDVPGLFEVETAQAFTLIRPAYADPVTDLRLVQAENPDTKVICVAQTDARTITRHIKLHAQCYDEPLDMLTGWVSAAIPVPCRTQCSVDQ